MNTIQRGLYLSLGNTTFTFNRAYLHGNAGRQSGLGGGSGTALSVLKK
jgi:hypothetical protein